MVPGDSMTVEEGMLTIASEDDIVTARTTIREVIGELGFGVTDVTRIVTAVSELARNIYLYAGTGTMTWRTRSDGDRRVFEIVFADDGPGIDDIEQALDQGYSTSEGMGLGLSGSAKLMDEFDIESSPDQGTTITIGKEIQ